MSDTAGTQTHPGTGSEPVFHEGGEQRPAEQPVDAASVYAAQIRGADTSIQVQNSDTHETSTGLDFTPRRAEQPNTPDVEGQPEVARQGGEGDAQPEPPTTKITVGGREFDSYEQAALHFATAHEEATRYISQTSRGDRDLADLDGGEEDDDQVEVRVGDPQTWEQARALAESDDLGERQRGFEWALRMRQSMPDFPEELYDEMVNGLAVANFSYVQRRLSEVEAEAHQARIEAAMGPRLQAEAHRATREGLDHFVATVGEAEAQAWEPYLRGLIAQGAILQDPNRVLDGHLVGEDLVQVYETLKGQQLMTALRKGEITPETYQAETLKLATLGQQAAAPAAAAPADGGQPRGPDGRFVAGGGQVVQHAPIAAGPQHTAHLVGDRSGPVTRAQNPAQTYVDNYRKSILSAPRSGY
jgi:hypothetical protein